MKAKQILAIVALAILFTACAPRVATQPKKAHSIGYRIATSPKYLLGGVMRIFLTKEGQLQTF